MRPATGTFCQQAVSAGVTEYSIWGSGVTGTLDVDGSSVVLGTKFRTNVNGNIRGIRWQRASTATSGAQIALWQGTTNVSGTTTTTGEATSGWSRMDFATPVAITASTLYIASVRYTAGRYYATGGLFTSAGVTNGPLEAVATTVSANGLYAYSGSMVVPANTWQGGCYFIDVIFAA